jgi:competence protein ComEC
MTWLIGFIAGVTLCAVLPSLPDWRIPVMCGVLLGGWLAFMPAWLKAVWRLLPALLFGLGYAAWCADARMAQALPVEWEMRPVTMVIVVRDLPARVRDGTRFLADVEQVETPGARVPDTLRLNAKGQWPAGSRWRVTARLKGRHATANPFGFDAEKWMWAQGILGSGNIVGSVIRLDDASDVAAHIDRLRERIAARIHDVLGPGRAAALIRALTVGDQQGIDRLDWRQFSKTGITHLVSISGLHIGMVAGLFAVVTRWGLRRLPPGRLPPRLIVAAVALAAAGGYALLAGWSVPTRRTFFMLMVAGGLMVWRRALSAFQIWWLALATVLLLDPFAVFFPGLWLSFGLVGALMLATIGRRRPPGKCHALLLGQWASSVMSIVPLSVFFSALPLISPLANLVAIPWISLLVAPLSLLAVALPFDAPLWLASWLASLFLDGIGWLARAPVLFVPGMPWPILMLALIGSFWLIAPSGFGGKGLGCMLLVPLFCHEPPRPPPGAFAVTVFDVGQGLSVLIRTTNHTLLYDTGALDADSVVLPQLAGLGIRQLDRLMLSHHDSDHDGAAADIVEALPVNDVWVGQAASAAGAERCLPGREWAWDGIHFEVMGPLSGISVQGNNPQSCVLRVAGAHHSILLAGDIPVQVESMLIERYGGRLASSVLFAPHHGSKTSSSPDFLRVVAPRFGVISAGYRNRYGHPHETVLAQYHAAGVNVVRTDHSGAIDIVLDQTVTLRHFRQAQPRYWRQR